VFICQCNALQKSFPGKLLKITFHPLTESLFNFYDFDNKLQKKQFHFLSTDVAKNTFFFAEGTFPKTSYLRSLKKLNDGCSENSNVRFKVLLTAS
jgi:hypothetical protein